MNPKKAGWIFLIEILITIGASIGLSIGSSFFELPLVANIILSEFILLLPCLVFALITERDFWRDDEIGYENGLVAVGCSRKYVLALVPVFTAFCMPLISLCDAISMIFVKNEVTAISSDVTKMPLWLGMALLAVFGPMCEEFVFRGVIYGSLRRSGNVIGAILVQALLFGLVHLNLNQFSYAFLAGILMALLVEATGSIEASYMMHMCINGFSTLLIYIDRGEVQNESYSTTDIILAIPSIAFMAVFCTAIAVGILLAITFLAGRFDRFSAIFSGKKKENDGEKRENVLNLPIIIGIIIALAVIIAEAVLEHI